MEGRYSDFAVMQQIFGLYNNDTTNSALYAECTPKPAHKGLDGVRPNLCNNRSIYTTMGRNATYALTIRHLGPQRGQKRDLYNNAWLR